MRSEMSAVRCGGKSILYKRKYACTPEIHQCNYKIWTTNLKKLSFSMKQSVTSIIWMRPLFINATLFSEIKNNSFCHSNISELRWLVLYDHKIKKRKHVFCRLSVRRSVGPSSVCKVINLEVPIFWVPIFEEYSLIVFQHIRRKKGKASYWCFLTK